MNGDKRGLKTTVLSAFIRVNPRPEAIFSQLLRRAARGFSRTKRAIHSRWYLLLNRSVRRRLHCSGGSSRLLGGLLVLLHLLGSSGGRLRIRRDRSTPGLRASSLSQKTNRRQHRDQNK